MENITTVRMELVTPEQAFKILETENYAGQRAIRTRHVNYLANEMLHGRFACGTKIHFAVTPERRHLVNGQHTCKAIKMSGIPCWLVIQETVC